MILLSCAGLASAAGADVSDYGIESVSASRSTSQAGDHPDFTTTIQIKTDPTSPTQPDGSKAPYGSTRDLSIALPAGMTGNPNAVAECSRLQFSRALFEGGGCPLDSQVGVTVLHLGLPVPIHEPVYNLEAPGGENVAQIGFYAYSAPVVVNVEATPEREYALTANGTGFQSSPALVTAETTLWGVPAADSHDTERFTAKEVLDSGGLVTSSPPRPSGLEPLAYMINPRSCGAPQKVEFSVDSYSALGHFISATATMPTTTGCDSLEFAPDISFSPTTKAADSASGMDVNLTVDQSSISQPNTTAPADLKKAVVTMPEGVSLNPAAATGLGSCSEAQVGLISESPIRFNRAAPSCPDSSKVGTARIKSPLLDEPIDGSLYVAEQGGNPFHSLLAGYLVARGQGATIKLAGRFDLNPATGRIVATFDQNPQQPFSDLALHFKGGEQGVLVTPPQCGTYSIETDLVPWSATDPENPTPAEIVHRSSSFEVNSGPAGAPCPNPPALTPTFSAGSASPLAGIYSPLIVKAARPDGSQILTGLNVQLPPGLTGKLAGIPYCPDASLAAAAGRSGAGELAAPSCSPASRVGTVTVGAGAGSYPFHIQGAAYLAGPYKGAPLSIAVITPALAGPFDLGTVVVRAALRVDPTTAQIHAISDPLPTILQGIPLHLRSVWVDVDRGQFSRNPTSCDPMRVEGTLLGTPDLRTLADRFQVGGCKGLDFAPKLALKLRGGSKRGGYPALRAVLKAKPGEAGIKKVSVALPHSEFLAQEHIKTICTRVQFAADQCPAGSIYGRARAFTPLLDKPLEGPVYLRSSSHPLPDLVVALDGQIEIDLAGRIDSFRQGIRTTFAAAPDAPVTKFVLRMKGGKKGLLVNSRDLCSSTNRAKVAMTGHNGKTHAARPLLRTSCGKKRGR